MKQVFSLTALLFLCFMLNGQPVKIMLVTGGHNFDEAPFFRLFNSLENIEYNHFEQPLANNAILNGRAKNYDVLVFYDMWQEISEKEKQAYIDLTNQGKPFLFLHHSLVSYQNWPEFEKIIGGKYIERSPDIPDEKQSTFKHDVWVDIETVDSEHPVTAGFNDFKLFDEVYGNFRVSNSVKPLLKTNHPESTGIIGWENKYNSSVIIYLQPGHDSNAFKSPLYRKLLFQAINYLSKTGK